MADTGATYPSVGESLSSGDANEVTWSTPGNIVDADTDEASITAATFDSPDPSYWLNGRGFGFSIPTDATINGILVEINRRSIIASSGVDKLVRLRDSNGNLIGADKHSATVWPGTLTTASYGGAADTWSTGLTNAQLITMLNSANFGVSLQAQANIANADIGVAWIRVTVYYTAPIARTATDTGLNAPNDSLLTRIARLFTDTGLNFTGDTLTGGKLLPRTATDTGLNAPNDAVGSRRTRALTDTGLNFSDGGIAITASEDTELGDITLDVGGDPGVDTDHAIHVVARVTSGSGTIRCALYESTNNRSGDLETPTLDGTLTEYTLPISEAAATTITDYGNLHIPFWGHSPTGADVTFEVDQIWLALPTVGGASRAASDTGLNPANDSILRAISRSASDTAAASDGNIASFATRPRSATDTGLSLTDQGIAKLRTTPRTASDTGLSLSDQGVRRAISHPLTDTGLALSDQGIQGGRTFARTASDTGLNASNDALVAKALRVLSDSGLALTDQGIAKLRATPRTASDNGLVFSDGGVAKLRTTPRSASDTGLALSDQGIGRGIAHPLSDSAAVSDGGVQGGRTFPRTATDTGLAQTGDSAHVVAVGRALSDTGLQAPADQIARAILRKFSDTGLAQTGDQIVRGSMQVAASDTGLSVGDTLVSARTHAATDTGLAAPNDSIAKLRTTPRTATDTALNAPNDQLRTADVRYLTDTGLAFSDGGISVEAQGFKAVTASDTGLAISDTTQTARSHALTDTALAAPDDQTRLAHARALADTGLSFSESLSASSAGQKSVTDTGLSFSESLARLLAAARAAADTGLSPGDSIASHVTYPRALGDSGVEITDWLASQLAAARTDSDTGLTVSDSIARTRLQPRTLTDTGLSIGDEITGRLLAAQRTIVDTALALADFLSSSSAGQVSVGDTGLAFSESLTRNLNVGRQITDTGLSIGDGGIISRQMRSVPDEGITSFSDHLFSARSRRAADTGLTVSDGLSRRATRTLTDVALSISDQAVRQPTTWHRAITDTGTAVSDQLTFTFTSDRDVRGVHRADAMLIASLTATASSPGRLTARASIVPPVQAEERRVE